jgi:hypothetical protein
MFGYVHPLRYRMSPCVTTPGSCVQHLVINFSASPPSRCSNIRVEHMEKQVHTFLSSVSRRECILQRMWKERIVGREDAEGIPDPPASRLRNACCSSLHIITFQSLSHFRVLLLLVYYFWQTHCTICKALMMMASASRTPMVTAFFRGQAMPRKGNIWLFLRFRTRPLASSIFRHSRVVDIGPRLKDLMWSHGG